MYDGERLVNEWSVPAGFRTGTKFNDEKLGEIRLKFTSTRPLQLTLKINKQKYKPHLNGKQQVDLSGAIAVFWALGIFTAIPFLIMLFVSIDQSTFRLNSIPLLWSGAVTALYIACGILMSKKLYWAFFVGTAYLTVSTFIRIYLISKVPNFGSSFFSYLVEVIRIILILYLLYRVQHVLFALRNKASKDEEILDGVI